MAQEPFLVTCTADEWFQEPDSLSKMENLQVTEKHQDQPMHREMQGAPVTGDAQSCSS